MNGVGFPVSVPGSNHKASCSNRARYTCELVFLMKYALAFKRHG